MDVTIEEVQAQVETPSPGRQARPEEGEQRMGITEKAREARLAERRAQRIAERLCAT
jgi:hypothetical protein